LKDAVWPTSGSVTRATSGRAAMSHTCRMATITFRPTPDDEQIINRARRDDENTTDVIRRASRLVDREEWLAQARIDAAALRDEDLNAEPDAW
jgi:hypothetical protein